MNHNSNATSGDADEWSDVEESGKINVKEGKEMSQVISKLREQGLEVSASTIRKSMQDLREQGLEVSATTIRKSMLSHIGSQSTKARGTKMNKPGRGRGRGGPTNK